MNRRDFLQLIATGAGGVVVAQSLDGLLATAPQDEYGLVYLTRLVFTSEATAAYRLMRRDSMVLRYVVMAGGVVSYGAAPDFYIIGKKSELHVIGDMLDADNPEGHMAQTSFLFLDQADGKLKTWNTSAPFGEPMGIGGGHPVFA